jgi:hypothetical protein
MALVLCITIIYNTSIFWLDPFLNILSIKKSNASYHPIIYCLLPKQTVHYRDPNMFQSYKTINRGFMSTLLKENCNSYEYI